MSLIADVKHYDDFEDDSDVYIHDGLALQPVAGTAVAPLPSKKCKLEAEEFLTGGRGRENGIVVVRGALRSVESPEKGPLNVVVKVALTTAALGRVIEEAKVYHDKLRDLSSGGDCIPRSYGVYHVASPVNAPEELCVGFLMLEDCGDPVGSFVHSDNAEDVSFRIRLLTLVHEIHARGLMHRQLSPYHVLHRDGTPYLVDFARAMDHQCPRNADRPTDAEYGKLVQPAREQFGCNEIYNLMEKTQAWLPAMFICKGRPWSARYFLENPEALANKMLDIESTLPALAPRQSPREALTAVHRAICGYYKQHLPARGAAYEDDLDLNLERYCQAYEDEVARNPFDA
ncbi:unnamed protein product [Peniophora sp. CBMAI 1063]|nr:unnamed protein product [Peniophora sp. CBMAI 1063]